MARTPEAQRRIDQIGARIAAARKKLAQRTDLQDAGIGGLLGAVNDDFDEVLHEEHDEESRRLDRIEARLRAEEIRLEDDAEDEDR
jgi:hypothetical protein